MVCSHVPFALYHQSQNTVPQLSCYAAVTFVTVVGCCSRSIGPAINLSREGAPGSPAITRTMLPSMSSAAGITDEFVFVSNGTVMSFTLWNQTAWYDFPVSYSATGVYLSFFSPCIRSLLAILGDQSKGRH